MAVSPAGAEPDPPTDLDSEDLQDRRPRDSITDYGAVAFILALFVLAIGLMYLINHGRA